MYAQDWKMYYQGVYRCNELITREDQIKWKDKDSNRGLYMGECHALRAFLYFDMVRLGATFLCSSNPSMKTAVRPIPQKSMLLFSKISNMRLPIFPAMQILKNHSSAVSQNMPQRQSLPVPTFIIQAITDRNPVSPMNPAKPQALSQRRKPLQLSKMSLPAATTNFGLIQRLRPASSLVANTTSAGWNEAASTYAGDANSEVVLSMNFTPMASYATEGSADGNRWQVMMGMRSPLSVVPYYCGWGACTVIPSFINSIYDAADPRRTAGVIDIAGEGIGSDANFKPSYNDWREYTGYTVKKYSPIAFYQLENGAPVIKMLICLPEPVICRSITVSRTILYAMPTFF